MSKIGLYVGRFQPLHEGHTKLINKALRECDTLIVAIGSARESRTIRNPLSYSERKRMITNIFFEEIRCGKLVITGVPDRDKPSNDSSWGVYLMDYVKKNTQLTPNIIFEGSEKERANWYDELDIEVVSISRNMIPISATKVRQYILDNQEFKYRDAMPIELWWWYEELRNILNEIQNN